MKTILCILAHPDDAEIWAGGTLLKCIDNGYRVFSACFETQDPERTKECISSAGILGMEPPIFLAKKKNWWTIDDDDFKSAVKLITDIAPDLIITHPHNDIHPEHRLIASLAMKAAIVAGDRLHKGFEMLACSSYNGMTLDGLFNPSIFVDITSHWSRKIEAIGEYHTQDPPVSIRLTDAQTVFYGNLVGAKRAEGFMAIPILGEVRPQSLLNNLT